MERKHVYRGKQYNIIYINDVVVENIRCYKDEIVYFKFDISPEIYWLNLDEHNLRPKEYLLIDARKLSIGCRCNISAIKYFAGTYEYNYILDVDNIRPPKGIQETITNIVASTTSTIIDIVTYAGQNVINTVFKNSPPQYNNSPNQYNNSPNQYNNSPNQYNNSPNQYNNLLNLYDINKDLFIQNDLNKILIDQCEISDISSEQFEKI